MAVNVGEMDLDCRKCNENLKVWRGCDKPSPNPQFELDGEVIERCPLKLITRQSAEYIRYYNFMEKGFLPNPGGILSQGAKFLDAVEIISREIIKIEKGKKRFSRKF